MNNNKQTKNNPPSSEFEHEDRCPSCGSPCNIHTDLDDKDYCNDCRVLNLH
jgi:C4-type Zn-finger protein